MGLRDAKNAVAGGFEPSTLHKFEKEGEYFEGVLVGRKIVHYEKARFGNGDVPYLEFRKVKIGDVPAEDQNGLFAIKSTPFLSKRMEVAFTEVHHQPGLMKGWRIGIEYKGKVKNSFGTLSDEFVVYADKNEVDHEWLKSVGLDAPVVIATLDGGTEADYETPGAVKSETPAFFGKEAPAEKSEQPFLTPAELESKIMEVMSGKYGCTDVASCKVLAMEKSGLIWTPANLEAIYEKVK